MASTQESRIVTVWRGRITAFNCGVPVPETLIGQIRRHCKMQNGVAAIFHEEGAVYGKSTIKWNIEAAQSVKGRAFLMSVEIWNKLADKYRAILDEFSHFKFVGVKACTPNFLSRPEYVPVYRVVGKSGEWFEYASSPWQSGSTPRFEVLCSGREA